MVIRGRASPSLVTAGDEDLEAASASRFAANLPARRRLTLDSMRAAGIVSSETSLMPLSVLSIANCGTPSAVAGSVVAPAALP